MESFVFPGNIEPEISLIASQPIPYMRTAAFSAIVKSSEQMLLNLIGCPNGRIIFIRLQVRERWMLSLLIMFPAATEYLLSQAVLLATAGEIYVIITIFLLLYIRFLLLKILITKIWRGKWR